jgi:phosphoribosylanthranilate isomerase
VKTWIKICGTTNLADAQAAVAAGADALGFIFSDSRRLLQPEQAKAIIDELPERIEKIGVFVNEPVERVMEIFSAVGLTGVQLHGDESAEYLTALRQKNTRGMRVIKSISANITLEQNRNAFAGSEEHVDAFMIDSGNADMRGGTGEVFDWLTASDFVSAMKQKKKVIVAGGLNPQNVAAAIGLFRPWGVDVVTGVEEIHGKKDHAKLQRFVAAVRDADIQGVAATP